ncbi:MAG: damage-inducible protein DinB [Proteobacteria bacterium]|nr:damage-inducible protein DinB [Pseudomonadota bacterium]
MEYQFLVDTYDTERLKTLGVWSMFKAEDLLVRPHPFEQKDRNPLEHMVHQCLSENKWFCNMFGIDVAANPLPAEETRLEFIKRYAEDSGKRLAVLRAKDKTWWEQEVAFFDARRLRTWIMLRRIAHTAHHRGEQTAILRMLGRSVYSIYGPSADTGGLPQNNAQTIYAYPDIKSLIEGESKGGLKAHLPGPGNKACTERPDL